MVINGTPVTKENFTAWRAKFEAEQKEKNKKTEEFRLTGNLHPLPPFLLTWEGTNPTSLVTLTGKQIFKLDPAYIDDQMTLKALAALKASNASYLDDDLDDEDGEIIDEGPPQHDVKVDTSLFVAGEEEDLPEFSDEEEN